MRDLRQVGWVTAWWWTSEILRDPYSHTASALRGDTYVPHPAEEAGIGHLEGWINAQRGKGKIAQSIERPWAGTPPKYDRPKVDDAGRDARRARLKAMSDRRAQALAVK